MYLVTGAAGHLGRSVVNHLLTTYKVPANQIIAATRDTNKIADLKAKGVETRAVDFNDPAGMLKSFAGAKRILIISTDSFEQGARQKQHAAAVAAADKAGAEHVVYTSMPHPETSAVTFAADHLNTEKALAASSIAGWTVLRHNWYFENLFMSLPQALNSGTHYSAAGLGRIPYIARDDLACADAAALLSARGKKTLTLSGAASYTIDEVTARVSMATGKPLKVVHVPVDGLVQGMVGAGLPEPLARIFASFDANTAQGGLTGDAADYISLTGQAPQTFEAWLASNTAGFMG